MTLSSATIEKRNTWDAKRDEFAKALTASQNGKHPDGSDKYDDAKLASGFGVPAERLGDELTRRRKEVDDLGLVFNLAYTQERLAEVEEESRKSGLTLPTGPRDDRPVRKGLGTLFVESKAYTERANRTTAEVKVDLKTLMQSDTLGGGGWAPTQLDQPGFTPFAVRPPQIIDFIPRFRTTQSAITFMEETTHTADGTVVEKAQGVAAGEVARVFTRQTRTVERIPASIPVTDEQLDDVLGIEDFLNQSLGADVVRRLDLQCYAGNGTTPNLAGITDHADIQTQAKGIDPTFDAIHKALTKVRVTGRGVPNVIFIHSTDWQDVILTRTADGLYILGNPAGAPTNRLWGLPVVPNEAATEGTACVGDTTYTGLYMRQELTFAIGFSGTQFVEGEKTVLATLRAAMVVRSGAKFCTVTGI